MIFCLIEITTLSNRKAMELLIETIFCINITWIALLDTLQRSSKLSLFFLVFINKWTLNVFKAKFMWLGCMILRSIQYQNYKP